MKKSFKNIDRLRVCTMTGELCRYFFVIAITVVFCSCEKDITISVKANKPLLVVEAYINNDSANYNYVILSRSQDYYSTDFQSIPVSGATVSITAGTRLADNSYNWDTSDKVLMKEANLPQLPASFRSGIYFDPKLFANPAKTLKGVIGKSYLLEIEAAGKKYSAIASLIQPVQIDSLTTGFPFTDDDGHSKVRMTNNYKDPDTLGNTQFYMWKYNDKRNYFGWGGFVRSRAPGTDDLNNGEYIRLTHPQGFTVGDSINYSMASVTRDVYNFWDSFNKAKDNNGPFSTPVILQSNIRGEDVTGCFSGFAISSKSIIAK